ncbi:unnamed protein product [Rotaria socialis]|uniref:Uncharacterized protein n=1 Tax=Rotaria socialis TaxID=392032 RepID=A0A818HJA1_9BILA|nr:unnamed protein product [Rotaria socialis]CAF3509668.1 unnamed protein product [Rotaria socialis]
MSSNFGKFCIVLLAIQQTVFCLKCYDCNRGTDGCGISFKSKGAGVIEDAATQSSVQCVKIVHRSNDNAIDRLMGNAAICSSVSPVDKISIYCCNNTDLCNGSPIKSASLTLQMVAVGISLLYVKSICI